MSRCLSTDFAAGMHLQVSMREEGHRRSWPGITVDILEATLSPLSKTRVMYRANLNFERFHKYFDHLLGRGFIEEKNNSNGHVVYQATERGRILLEAIRRAQELFSEKV